MKMNFIVHIRPTLLLEPGAPQDKIRRELLDRLFDLWFIEDRSDCLVQIQSTHRILISVEQDVVDSEVLKDRLYILLFNYFDNGIECDSDIEVQVIV